MKFMLEYLQYPIIGNKRPQITDYGLLYAKHVYPAGTIFLFLILYKNLQIFIAEYFLSKN